MSSYHEPQSFWRQYVFSTDHKTIGKQYLFTAMFMALFAVAWSILMRIQLTWPDATWPIFDVLFPGLYEDGTLQPERYLSLVTMHGTVMVFFVISLTTVSGFGNFIIPLQIGARDMAYPFLNMLSYWTVVPACLLMLGSFFVPAWSGRRRVDFLSTSFCSLGGYSGVRTRSNAVYTGNGALHFFLHHGEPQLYHDDP